jgi:plastocyanin
MTRIRTLTILCLAAAAVLVPGAAHSSPASTNLVAVVGTNNSFTIDLTDESGTPVRHLDPGTYTILVHDQSQQHNFHLLGTDVNQATTVPFVGDVTWTVTFTNGTYTYQCDVHRYDMSGDFTVGTPSTTPAPSALTGTVGPRRTIALRDGNGARVKSLAAGRFVVTIRDRTKTDNFRLRGPGVNRATGVRFRGTVRWAVDLVGGSYTYRSDRHKTLHGSFTVSPSP